ncbi:MAG: TrkH family potassium uptake protein [Oscillospiraceae bacterium]|nr:TrkH family potassium uptake protein [Oscillospiraceae bacterium]
MLLRSSKKEAVSGRYEPPERARPAKPFSRTKQIMLGFLVIILIGSLLLELPISTKEGQTTDYSGALFTSVSATCVTGLVVYDTYTHWTIFGQLVILLMIQIGGLGLITITSFAMIILRRRIGLNSRELIRESLNTPQLHGSVRLVRTIIRGTLLVEGIGALLLSIRFVPQLGFGRGIYYGIFHSISAFCNAGFDLMGYQGEFSSLTAYTTDPLVSIVIMLLILIGGIGFLVWDDILVNKYHFKRYRLQTKIVLVMTAILVFGGALLFFIFENSNLLSSMNAGEKVLASFFASVTPRTAGFNTISLSEMTNASKLLTVIFMFIGGCPGSTAGGVKVTTIAVIFLYIKSYLLHTEDCVVFNRRLDKDAMKRASVIIFINLSLALVMLFVIMATQDFDPLDVMLEVFSATGTVGLSAGITSQLNTVSRTEIMILMYLGRVGSLTFAMSFTERHTTGNIRYPEERVIIG